MQAVAPTTLVEARVYRKGALLTREGTVTLEQGANRVYLTGTPHGVDRESVRVKFPQSVTQGTVQVVDATKAGLFEDDQRKVDDIRKRLKAIEQRIANKKSERDLWVRNADFTGGSAATSSDRADFLERFAERLDAIDADLAQLADERDAIEDEFKELASPIVDDDGTVLLPTALLLEVEAQQAGEYRFQMEYQVANASWQPLYEIRVDQVGEPVELRLRGEVAQRTGEDWKDIRLGLASGDMRTEFAIPELRSLYIDYHVNKPKPSSRAMLSMEAMSAPQAMTFGAAMPAPSGAPRAYEPAMAADEPLREVVAPTAEKTEQETMSAYDLRGTWDIESGSLGRIVSITSYTLPADYRMLCIPCEDDGAYLTAHIHGLEGVDLYHCDASVYLEGAYVGATTIDPDEISDEQTIPLGKDERVHVTRKRTRHHTSTSPLSSKKKVESVYEITVRSLRSDAVAMTVRDRVPVSRNSDIVVNVGQLSGGTLDEETGHVEWEFTIEGGAEKTVTLEYVVSYPKARVVDELLEPKKEQTAVGYSGYSGSLFCPCCGRLVEGGLPFCPSCGNSMR